MLSSQRINQAFVYFALCVFLANTIFYLAEGVNFFAIIVKSLVYVPLLGAIYFQLLQSRFDKLRKLSHITFLFLIASIAIFESSDSVYGLGFALVGLYLMYKYRLMRKRPIAKIIVFFSTLSALIFLSSGFREGWVDSILTIAFLVFFYVILFLGELDWIQRYRRKQKEEHLMRSTLKDVEGRPIDLEALGFTRRELEIGKLLVERRRTDNELSSQLFISTNTFRNHLKSMRAKTQTTNTNDLIEAIRWYYYKAPFMNKGAQPINSGSSYGKKDRRKAEPGQKSE